MRRALTIAGSDSSGGAGIQADLRAFSAFGVYGMSVVTAVTAQNTSGVQGVFDLPPEFVALQLDSVLSDRRADAAKTGMLSNRDIVRVVTEKLREYEVLNLVVDPVMVAGSGEPLMRAEGRDWLKELLPLARVVTPNLDEAQFLCECEVKSVAGMRRAAEVIHRLGPEWVVIKGGHLDGDPVDILYDGSSYTELRGERIRGETHGTGCVFSAAITAGLAGGEEVEEAIKGAKAYTERAIKDFVRIESG